MGEIRSIEAAARSHADRLGCSMAGEKAGPGFAAGATLLVTPVR